MILRDKNFRKIIVTHALAAAVMYIAYFFIMQALGLTRPEFRIGNFVLFFIAGYAALRRIIKTDDNRLDYVQGLGITFLTGTVSFVFFAVFVYLYSFIDPVFTNTVLQVFPGSFVFGRFAAPFLIICEGTAFSVIFALCLMQYFRIYTGRHEVN